MNLYLIYVLGLILGSLGTTLFFYSGKKSWVKFVQYMLLSPLVLIVLGLMVVYFVVVLTGLAILWVLAVCYDFCSGLWLKLRRSGQG